MADLDLKMEGGGGHADPEIRGGEAVSKKLFFGRSGFSLVLK